MKKSKNSSNNKIIAIGIFVLLSAGVNMNLGATTFDHIFYNAQPGFWDKFGISPNPTDCRSAVANLSGSGDHLYGSLYHANTSASGYEWGTPVETYNATKGTYYHTPKATIDCESMDGAYGQVRNVSAPTEKFVNRYEYNY